MLLAAIEAAVALAETGARGGPPRRVVAGRTENVFLDEMNGVQAKRELACISAWRYFAPSVAAPSSAALVAVARPHGEADAAPFHGGASMKLVYQFGPFTRSSRISLVVN